MANDDPRAIARGTQKKDRFTGPAHQGLAPAGGRNAPAAHGKKAAAPADTRPLLLVGKLGDLTPKALSVSADKEHKGPAHDVDTSRIDFRKAKGFDKVLETSLSDLGYPVVQRAEVRAVNSNAEFLRAAQAAGSRQVIYFGHSAGPGGLLPGGIDAPAINRGALEKAFAGGGPRPIFLGCNAAGTPLVGAPSPANAIGLDRDLKFGDMDATVSNSRAKTVTAKNIEVTGIKLSVGEKGFAPQAPLHPREAGAPP